MIVNGLVPINIGNANRKRLNAVGHELTKEDNGATIFIDTEHASPKMIVPASCNNCGEIRFVLRHRVDVLCKKCSAVSNLISANEANKELVGENSPFYDHSLSIEERKIRTEKYRMAEFKRWSFDVKKRDNFTCQICSDDKGGNLHSHHLNSFSAFPNERIDIDNGVCLCECCHKSFHGEYGRKKNTKEQFEEFKINRMEVSDVI